VFHRRQPTPYGFKRSRHRETKNMRILCREREREREQLSRQLNQPNKGAEEHLESQTPLFENAFFSAISRYSTHFTCGDRVV
jgi:hypothetical protein